MGNMQLRYWIVTSALALLVLYGSVAWAAGTGRPEAITRAGIIAALEQSAGPKKGSGGAPIVLVYFTDFQCGYCRKFAQETLPKLNSEYVQKGLAQLVFRNLAILGPPSVQAAQAAACAQDQGRFWDFHDRLFAGNSAPTAFTDASLKQVADELKLDQHAFTACYDGSTYAQKVESETLLAQALGARGTPAFLVNGQLAMGAYPFEAFQQVLDSVLKDKEKTPRP